MRPKDADDSDKGAPRAMVTVNIPKYGQLEFELHHTYVNDCQRAILLRYKEETCLN